MVGAAEFILCPFNANGMDKDMTSFLSEERIVALAVQEAKLNTNNLSVSLTSVPPKTHTHAH